MKFTMQQTALALAFLGASAGAIKVDFTSDGASISRYLLMSWTKTKVF